MRQDGGKEYQALRSRLNNAIGHLPKNKKLEDALSKLRKSSTANRENEDLITFDQDSNLSPTTNRGLSKEPTDRLYELIALRNQHFQDVGIKSNTTKTKARLSANPALNMIDDEIVKITKLIANTIEPEIHNKKTEQVKDNHKKILGINVPLTGKVIEEKVVGGNVDVIHHKGNRKFEQSISEHHIYNFKVDIQNAFQQLEGKRNPRPNNKVKTTKHAEQMVTPSKTPGSIIEG